VKRSEVLVIRREVNRQRRAGITEAQIARHLRALRLAPPAGDAWEAAGITSPWTAHGVTRFMETTRHVKAAPIKSQPAEPPPPTPPLAPRVRGEMIYTSAPDPGPVLYWP
jgi:hypothetical protein